MKRTKSIVTVLIVLAMSLSLLVACKPADDGDIDVTTQGGGTTTGDNTAGDNTAGDNTAGDNTTGDNTTGNNTTGDNTAGGNTTGGGTTTGGNTSGGGSGVSQTPNDGDLHTLETSENPLLKKGKAYNKEAAVSYNLDQTGFVKDAKLSDLKGKTLTLYTGADYAMWTYYDKSGKAISEWSWFTALKSLYGVTVKYVRSQTGPTSVMKAFQAMSAGKDIDLITTHVGSFPYICNIMEPLDGYVNMDNFSNSAGLDPQLTNLTKWKGKYIVLGPACCYGGLTYNKTYLKSIGVKDPYELFRAGNWNWSTFKNYMNSLPATTSDGKKLYGCSSWGQYFYWANTNGSACFEIEGDNPNGGIKNNLDSAAVKEAFTWLEGVCKGSKATYLNGDASAAAWGTDKSAFCCMWYSAIGTVNSADMKDANAKNVYAWVPFPKNEKNKNAVNHVEVYGYGIGIPRKTNKEGNRQAAVKFCELWCNRFAESRFDHWVYKNKWSYDDAVFAYEFGRTNARFGLGSGVGNLSSIANTSNFNRSFTDASFSVSTCLAKMSNLAKKEVENVLRFGVQ